MWGLKWSAIDIYFLDIEAKLQEKNSYEIISNACLWDSYFNLKVLA